MEFINEYLLPHWPFILFTLVISVVAQIMKTQIFTERMARKSKIMCWIRRVFPLVLILFGAITGMIWPGQTSPGVTGTTENVLYFMGSACVAIAGFNIFKNWVKKKYDVDLMSSDSEPPAPKR